MKKLFPYIISLSLVSISALAIWQYNIPNSNFHNNVNKLFGITPTKITVTHETQASKQASKQARIFTPTFS